MADHGFRFLDEETVYSGWILDVAKARFEAPDGSTFDRDVVHHPGAVAIVPIVDGDVVLVRQYRPAIDKLFLEIPAGLRDVADEPPIETAQRELIEEIGMRAGQLTPISVFHNSVGFSDEEIHLFLGTDLELVEREMTNSPEEQSMEIVRLSLADAQTMITNGEITDAKTIIGVLSVLSVRE